MRAVTVGNRRCQRTRNILKLLIKRFALASAFGTVQANEAIPPIPLARPSSVQAIATDALSGIQGNEIDGNWKRGCKVFYMFHILPREN